MLANPVGVRPSSITDIHVRLLGEIEWQLYRNVRLAALRDAPDAFIARFEDEASYDDDFWRERMSRAARLVAERGNEMVGLVSLGLHDEDPQTGEVFGLWAAPSVRGQHVARDLVATARRKAAEDDRRLLIFGWSPTMPPRSASRPTSVSVRRRSVGLYGFLLATLRRTRTRSPWCCPS